MSIEASDGSIEAFNGSIEASNGVLMGRYGLPVGQYGIRRVDTGHGLVYMLICTTIGSM